MIEKCLKKFLEKEKIEYEIDKKEGIYSLDLVLKSPTSNDMPILIEI